MHDIRAIRDNPAAFVSGWSSRGVEDAQAIVDRALELDRALRAAQTAGQEALAKRNAASKLIGAAMARKDMAEAERLKGEVESLKGEIAAQEAVEAEAGTELRDLLATEQVLEASLADLPAMGASPDLRRTILDIPLDHPRAIAAPSLAQLLLTGWRRWTAGMATVTAAGLIGFVLGYGQLVTLPTATAGEQVAGEDLVSMLGDTPYLDAADAENAE